jgi:photosystem II stability/assembly factor-like uncharacterized protein
MSAPRDQHDVDELLRASIERLAPRDGTWELVRRKARRRKLAKAGVSVAAGMIVLAGAVPAVIAVRHNADDQTLTYTNGQGPQQKQASGLPTPTPVSSTAAPATAAASSPAVSADLTGFFPDSVSFVTQLDGYAWGSMPGSAGGVVADTIDGGLHWSRLPAPPVDDAAVSASPNADGQIRFWQSTGFVYGGQYFVTVDGGESWTQYTAPGYIDDLETMNGRVWALVRPSRDSTTVKLYSATTENPALQAVTATGTMHGVAGADSIAVNKASVAVIVGGSAFWTSPDGVRWHQGVDPCGTPVDGGNAQSALLTTLNLGDDITACGYNMSGGAEDKRVFATSDNGRHWTPTAAEPAATGYLETLAAGTSSDLVIGTSRGGAQVTRNGGASWQSGGPAGTALGFVGFIDPRRVVAVTDRADAGEGAFATSYNAGKTWQVTRFSK